MTENEVICGIDLGTTNSLITLWQDGQAQIIANSLGQHLTPSAIHVDDNDTILVGQAAKERLTTHPHQTAINFKRFMGTNREISLGKRMFRAEELSSFVIRSLVQDAEVHLGEKITEAVITVPAYFNDAQRKATKIAGELAGIKVERLLNEPTAAAMAYGLHTKGSDSQYLILDLGGGTFDVSILEMFDNVMEVHASAGDNQLGGTDFTAALAQHFLTHADLKSIKLKKDRLPEEFIQHLQIQAEKAKREIGKNGHCDMSVTWKERTTSLAITESEFDKAIEPLLERMVAPIKTVLNDARLRVADIDDIVLVGGATRMPCIKKLVTRLLQRFPASGIDPDEVVATGAGVQAGLKVRDEMLDDLVLTDVCPYTLGIDTVSGPNDSPGYFHPIIERNKYIPVSRVERFSTVRNNQEKIDICIYQGENPSVKDNIALGKVSINIPKARAHQEEVDVRFTYDINGILEVIVTALSTKESAQLIIEDNPGVLSKDEIAERLKALEAIKIHPRDLQENLVIIHRAERLYREHLGKERMRIGELLAQFNALLEEQDDQRIEVARKQMSEVLDHFDGEFRF